MSEIVENLFLSSLSEIKNNRNFMVNKTSLSINAAEEVNLNIHGMIKINLGWSDSPVQDINENGILFHLIKLIDCYINCGKGVLVNCFAGVSRSATIVVAYVMYKNKMSVLDGIQFVRTKRPFINPNYGFVAQLYQLQDKIHNLDTIDFIKDFHNKDYKELCEEVDTLYKTVPFIKEITSREIFLTDLDFDIYN